MSCYNNFIGIAQSCTPNASKSKMYIEDYPGLSIKSISLLEGGKYITAQNLIDAKTKVAFDRIEAMLGMYIGETFVNQNTGAIVARNFGETYRDAVEGICGLYAEKKPTALTKLQVNRFYFKSHTAVEDLDIVITDGVTSEIHTISAEADEEITIEANFISNSLFVNIQYSPTPSNEVQPYTMDCSPYNKYAKCVQCNDKGNQYLMVQGLSNGVKYDAYYGIRADIQLVCDRSKMVCLLAPNNKMLFFNATIREVFQEMLASDRINYLAVTSKDWIRDQISELDNKIEEFVKSNGYGMRKYLKNMETGCFTCSGATVKYTIG